MDPTLLMLGDNILRVGLVSAKQTSTVTGYTYSPVYVGGGNACVYEQIFSGGATDPEPNTEDWMSPITSFVPNDWTYFKMSASAYTDANTAISPICRAIAKFGTTVPLSATLFADGINAGFNWTQYSSFTSDGTTYACLSAALPDWEPLYRICGNRSASDSSFTATVSVYNPCFGGGRGMWESGGCQALSGQNMFMGAVQFCRAETGSGTVYVPAGTSTQYIFTGGT